MPARVFLLLLTLFSLLVLLTSPPILGRLLSTPVVRPTATWRGPTITPSPSPTADPFAAIPTATPLGAGQLAEEVSVGVSIWPTIASTLPDQFRAVDLASDFTAISRSDTPSNNSPDTTNAIVTLPSPTISRAAASMMQSPPTGQPPQRLQIPTLGLDVPVEAVGLVENSDIPGVLAWGVPDYRAAGWLDSSAPLGTPGNTVLAGHHNIHGEVFRDLWTLAPGDEVTLASGVDSRTYLVDQVLILPERDQPLEIRLDNARYILPTDDDRLTLVTCWPYDNNTHRTIVIAFPTDKGYPR